MTVTIASTASSEADHAVSENWREKPPTEQPKPDTGKPSRMDELAPKDYIEVREQQQQDEKQQRDENVRPKKKGGYLRKIERLEAERKELLGRLSRYETIEAPRPGPNNARDSVRTSSAQELPSTVKAAENTAGTQSDSEASKNAYDEAITSTKARFADWEQVVGQEIEIPEAVARTILRLGNPEVSYFLGKNPQICEQLRQMPTAQAVAAVERMANDLRKDETGQRYSAEQDRAHGDAIRAALSTERNGKDLQRQSANIPITPAVADAIREQDNVGEIFVHLARNPDLVKTLNSMPPLKAVAQLGRLSERLESAKAQTKERISPPPPVRAVGGGSARSTVPMDQLSPKEYISVRQQQIRFRGGR